MQVRKHLAYCYNPSICCGRWSKTAMTMKLQQLRYLCGIAREGFSMSRAASALGTSQPAISKQISLLESELGVDLLIRKSNRILGLTAAGEASSRRHGAPCGKRKTSNASPPSSPRRE